MASSISGVPEDTQDVMHLVNQTLKAAMSHGLEDEVFATAFIYLKNNPKTSIQEALDVGLGDWDIDVPF